MKLFKKKFREIKRLPGWLYGLGAALLKTLKICMRTKVDDPYHSVWRKDAVVTVTWHNRLLFFPIMFPAAVRKRTVAVVSPSRDGQYIADLIARLGLRSLRGSTYKQGMQVQRDGVKAIRDGFHVSFTPDGPRGPKYKMSKGAIHLASLTGAKLLPIAVNYSSYWQVNSWDNFQIPKPWARVTLVLGEELIIPPNLSDAELAEWCDIVEKRLKAISID